MTRTKNAPKKEASPTFFADQFRQGNYGIVERRRRETPENFLAVFPRVKSRSRGRRSVETPKSGLIVPTLIPWADIKGEVLEELLYWLLEEYGLRDLRWRRGGSTTNANDGGRDIEGVRYGTGTRSFKRERWWIEAKGRLTTVEKSAVQEAVHNATGLPDVDVLVIATNAQFSNPTQDWVRDWQRSHKKPRVWLWARENLEALMSEHPSAVARLFSEALSRQGQLEFVQARFWRFAQFTNAQRLHQLWQKRADLRWTTESLVAVTASEAANGDLSTRSWLVERSKKEVESTLDCLMRNLGQLYDRAERLGTHAARLLDASAYVTLVALHLLGAKRVARVVQAAVSPDPLIGNTVLAAVLRVAQIELGDVCAKRCTRIMLDPLKLTEDAINGYWKRFVERPVSVPFSDEYLTNERFAVPCAAGLELSDRRCPFLREATTPTVKRMLADLEQVVRDAVARGSRKHLPIAPSP
jgi:hypothetical protein